MNWRFELASHQGSRDEQQDRISVIKSKNQEFTLAVLSDGLGGHSDGGKAAQIVVDTAQQKINENGWDDPHTFLNEICFKCHEKISSLKPGIKLQPATTCVLMMLRGEEAYWVHVGDSRLYHFRGSEAVFRTRDHTLSELNKVNGEFLSENLQPTVLDDRLTMCLGGKNKISPEYGATAVGDTDWFMICSDGIWSELSPDQIAQWVNKDDTKTGIATYIANEAVKRGGRCADNSSVILAFPVSDSSKNLIGDILDKFRISKN